MIRYSPKNLTRPLRFKPNIEKMWIYGHHENDRFIQKEIDFKICADKEL